MANTQLPNLNLMLFSYILVDSEEIRKFIENTLSLLNTFISIIISAHLLSVAIILKFSKLLPIKTAEYYNIWNTNLTEEF